MLKVAQVTHYTAVGIDHIHELVDTSRTNLTNDDKEGLLESGQITLVVGDGRKCWSQLRPYNSIHDRIVIPVGPDGGDQSLDQIDWVSRERR